MVARSSTGAHLAWGFVKLNWDRVRIYVPWFGSVLQDVAALFSTPADLADVEAFFRAHPEGASANERGLILESIRANIRWQQAQRAPVLAWLQARG
jgi:hypothetical protein